LLEGETEGIEVTDYDLDSISVESDNSGPTKWPLDSSSSNPSPSVVRRNSSLSPIYRVIIARSFYINCFLLFVNN
jgi:hypothetical protein